MHDPVDITPLDIEPTEPDCPNCGTRTMHRAEGEYWCRNCEVIVVDLGV